MATAIQMPKLGLTMTEGTIAEWVAAEGQRVAAGDVVLVIETDKVEAEVEAVAPGIVFPTAAVGESLEPGAGVGWLLDDDEELPAGSAPAASVAVAAPAPQPSPAAGVPGPAGGGRLLASPNARRVAAELGVDLTTVTGTGPGGRITSEDVEAARPQPAAPAPVPAAGVGAASGRFVPYTAAKAAERLGVDIDQVAGTGPEGRVRRQDVYDHARSHGVQPPAPTPAAAGLRPGDRVPLTGMRGVIAERMHGSLQEMAQLTLTTDVDMDRAVELRTQLSEIGAEELGAVPGYTDLVIAAAARALRAHPLVNARVEGDEIVVLDGVHVGMAVSVPDGLVVPVIREADQLGLVDLALESRRLAEAARNKQLTLDELEGGTFSVTALGMYGVDAFTPVVNPPNAAILGVGRLRDDVAWDGEVPRRVQRLMLSLTWDHRVLDGAPAAAFAQTVKAHLEVPLRLLG